MADKNIATSTPEAERQQAAKIIIVALLVILTGVGIWFWQQQEINQLKSEKAELQAELEKLQKQEETGTKNATTVTKTELAENILASLNSNNTAAIGSYMTAMVNVILQATECCGNISQAEAVDQLDYLNNAEKPWTEAGENIISSIESGPYAERIQNAVVLVSADGYLAAFKLNADNKISEYTLAVNYELLQ